MAKTKKTSLGFGPLDKSLVMALARNTRLVIRVVTGGLVIIFTWLKLSGVEIVPIARELPAGIVLQISLALYYLCWVAGSTFDVDAQELVYEKAPNRGRIPLAGYGLMFFLAAVFALLCWVSTYEMFVPVLGIFWIINICGWLYLVKKLLPKTLSESRSTYIQNEEYAQLERLALVTDYMCGRWQYYRFACGGALLALIGVLTFSTFANILADASNGLSVELIMALSIFAFILIMEAWIWFMRLKLKISLHTVEAIGYRYTILPVR